MSARVMQVIETMILCRGAGTIADPCRTVTQYWSEKGVFLAEVDPLAITLVPGDDDYGHIAAKRGKR